MDKQIKLNEYITSAHWRNIFKQLVNPNNKTRIYKDTVFELIGFQYSFNPKKDFIISRNTSVFQIIKAKKMYQWYKSKDIYDKSIVNYFPEYRSCFYGGNKAKCNSNYGSYAFSSNGLDLCIKRLKYDYLTRHACFCINNNKAMTSPDKLCTNAIQFRISNDRRLKMVIQMRSSNFLTLLPYDIFNFTIFYAYVYDALKETYKKLKTSNIIVQVNSLHCYLSDIERIKRYTLVYNNIDLSYPDKLIDFSKNNIIKNLETNLENYV